MGRLSTNLKCLYNDIDLSFFLVVWNNSQLEYVSISNLSIRNNDSTKKLAGKHFSITSIVSSFCWKDQPQISVRGWSACDDPSAVVKPPQLLYEVIARGQCPCHCDSLCSCGLRDSDLANITADMWRGQGGWGKCLF